MRDSLPGLPLSLLGLTDLLLRCKSLGRSCCTTKQVLGDGNVCPSPNHTLVKLDNTLFASLAK